MWLFWMAWSNHVPKIKTFITGLLRSMNAKDVEIQKMKHRHDKYIVVIAMLYVLLLMKWWTQQSHGCAAGFLSAEMFFSQLPNIGDLICNACKSVGICFAPYAKFWNLIHILYKVKLGWLHDGWIFLVGSFTIWPAASHFHESSAVLLKFKQNPLRVSFSCNL